MDNLAHSLVGLAAAKAGLEKLSPGATTVCILAANVPDIDFLAALSGDRWTVLHHHRGFSHSIVGTLLLGFIVPSLFYLIGLLVSRLRGRATRLKLRGLLVASLITAATHPILDWTNSYGVRPLLPWNGRWFYGDIVFVVDPLIWLLVGASVVMLTAHIKPVRIFWIVLATVLTALVVYSTTAVRGVDYPAAVLTVWITSLVLMMVGYKFEFRRRFGERLAVASLLLLLAYWGSLSLLHTRAMAQANEEIAKIASEKNEKITLVAATSVVVNPIRWRCLAETDRGVYRFDVDLWKGGTRELVRYEKPTPVEAATIASATKDRRAVLFFEFARFPVERIVGSDCTTQTLVQFADLRYTEPGRTRGSFSLEVPVECPGLSTENGR